MSHRGLHPKLPGAAPYFYSLQTAKVLIRAEETSAAPGYLFLTYIPPASKDPQPPMTEIFNTCIDFLRDVYESNPQVWSLTLVLVCQLPWLIPGLLALSRVFRGPGKVKASTPFAEIRWPAPPLTNEMLEDMNLGTLPPMQSTDFVLSTEQESQSNQTSEPRKVPIQPSRLALDLMRHLQDFDNVPNWTLNGDSDRIDNDDSFSFWTQDGEITDVWFKNSRINQCLTSDDLVFLHPYTQTAIQRVSLQDACKANSQAFHESVKLRQEVQQALTPPTPLARVVIKEVVKVHVPGDLTLKLLKLLKSGTWTTLNKGPNFRNICCGDVNLYASWVPPTGWFLTQTYFKQTNVSSSFKYEDSNLIQEAFSKRMTGLIEDEVAEDNEKHDRAALEMSAAIDQALNPQTRLTLDELESQVKSWSAEYEQKKAPESQKSGANPPGVTVETMNPCNFQGIPNCTVSWASPLKGNQAPDPQLYEPFFGPVYGPLDRPYTWGGDARNPQQVYLTFHESKYYKPKADNLI